MLYHVIEKYSNQDILPSSALSSKCGSFWFQKTKMATAVMQNSMLHKSW